MSTILTLEGSFARAKLIFPKLELTLVQGQKIALLGRNGSGKTTLLELLAQQLLLEQGFLWLAPDLRIGFLSQHPQFAANQSVFQVVQASFPYAHLERELRSLERNLQDVAALERYGLLQQQFEAQGGYRWPQEAAEMLDILQLSSFVQREAESLSGGEKTRLNLALTLLKKPDLLLLDEPTNHLDIAMRLWLEGYLKSLNSTVIFTSHDRALLDAVAQTSWWIEQRLEAAGEHRETREIRVYKGGYQKTLATRALERRQLQKTRAQTLREQSRLEQSAVRLDRWGRRSSGVKTRMERLRPLEAPLAERRLYMNLLSGSAKAKLLLWGRGLEFGYEGNRPATPQPILKNLSLRVRQGDRIALMAPNGAGKTTFLRLLLGQLHSSNPASELHFEGGAKVAYLDQEWHGLQQGKALLAQLASRLGHSNAVQALGRYGFGADYWDYSPEHLSGGERSRAGLALISELRADVLLLDEPTNHLDVETLESLEEALLAYPGAVIIVTHDRRFADSVANRVWMLEGGGLLERSSWNAKDLLDPAFEHPEDEPIAVNPTLNLKQHRDQLEKRLLELNYLLLERRYVYPLSGREEGRLQAERHQIQLALYQNYAQVYAAPPYTLEVRQKPLWVQGVALEEMDTGVATFWAKKAPDCPTLHWDGTRLEWISLTGMSWFRKALLLGALQILFERWDAPQVRVRGVTVTPDLYLRLTRG